MAAGDNPTPAGFALDERWQAVADETLRRPPIPLSVPSMVCHLGFMTDSAEANAQHAHVHELLTGWGADIQLDRFDQIIAESEEFAIKWERHTEFCSLSLFARNAPAVRERDPDLSHWPALPDDWKNGVAGQLLVALKVLIEPEDSPDRHFVPKSADAARAMSRVNSETADVEVSYNTAPDGFVHARITTNEDVEVRTGRLVQRFIEIETYRVLTLCAWPEVQAMGPRLNEIDAGVARLTEAVGASSGTGKDEERKLLTQLTDLARELEKITAQTHFRLNASLAYSDLVERRLEELREERIEGVQRVSSLINRRLRPAARTYRSILTRQSEMSDRISRTSDLLRSRIDVELAEQNSRLLISMDERADQALRLQQTVEGLSVVAISYYALGILTYLFAPLGDWLGEAADTKFLVGLAAPLVLLVVFLFVRRIRHAIGRK